MRSAAAGQRWLIGAQQRGCSRLPAAGDSLAHCPDRTSLPLGRPEALLLQKQLCLHLLGPGTCHEGLELLPEGCGGTVMGRSAGGACSAKQRGISVLLGRLWAATLILRCSDPEVGKFGKSPSGDNKLDKPAGKWWRWIKMGQLGKEQMLWGSVVHLSKALLTSFYFALKTELFCLGTTSPRPVSPIPFHDLSHLSPGYVLGLPSCLHPCPVLHPLAVVMDVLALSVHLVLKCCPKMLGPRSD